jgi:hypothetical protein
VLCGQNRRVSDGIDAAEGDASQVINSPMMVELVALRRVVPRSSGTLAFTRAWPVADRPLKRANARSARAHFTLLQLTGLPSQSEAVKVAVGFIPRMDITNDSVA